MSSVITVGSKTEFLSFLSATAWLFSLFYLQVNLSLFLSLSKPETGGTKKELCCSVVRVMGAVLDHCCREFLSQHAGSLLELLVCRIRSPLLCGPICAGGVVCSCISARNSAEGSCHVARQQFPSLRGSLSWARTMSLPTETYVAFTPSTYLILGQSPPGEVSQAEAQGKDRERLGPREVR